MGERTRPEEQHYDQVEGMLLRSIAEGKDFLFDGDKFEAELRRLWEEFDFPYQVRVPYLVCRCWELAK